MSIINKVEDRRMDHVIARNIERNINRTERIYPRSSGTKKKQSKIKDLIINHVYENIKGYLIITFIFLIGIVAGVIFINHIDEDQLIKVQEYINEFITAVKGEYQIDKGELLKNSLLDNLKLVIAMWFIGSTVIGLPIVLGIVLYRGFCIGYTVSASIAILGTQKGIIFSLVTMLFQNIIFIPALFILAVSGIRLYKSIMKDKRKENIKLEIIRHTMYSFLVFVLLIIVSLIEVYISSNLFTMVINFF